MSTGTFERVKDSSRTQGTRMLRAVISLLLVISSGGIHAGLIDDIGGVSAFNGPLIRASQEEWPNRQYDAETGSLLSHDEPRRLLRA
jgi:hypothetical protein